MPATSGSPTQIKTSAATAADLAGTPDDAFSPGDLAYVIALGRFGTFQLDRSSTAAVDNLTVIATYSGNGRWVLLPLSGAGWGDRLAQDYSILPASGEVALVTIADMRMPFAGGLLVNAYLSGYNNSDVAGRLSATLDVDGVTYGAVNRSNLAAQERFALAVCTLAAPLAAGLHTIELNVVVATGQIDIDALAQPSEQGAAINYIPVPTP